MDGFFASMTPTFPRIGASGKPRPVHSAEVIWLGDIPADAMESSVMICPAR